MYKQKSQRKKLMVKILGILTLLKVSLYIIKIFANDKPNKGPRASMIFGSVIIHIPRIKTVCKMITIFLRETKAKVIIPSEIRAERLNIFETTLELSNLGKLRL